MEINDYLIKFQFFDLAVKIIGGKTLMASFILSEFARFHKDKKFSASRLGTGNCI